jgi:hypothetical protein
MFDSFPRWGNFKQSFFLYDLRNLVISKTQVNLCCLSVFPQFVRPDICLVLLLETKHQNRQFSDFHGNKGSCASTDTLSLARKPEFEESSSEIRIEWPIHRVP